MKDHVILGRELDLFIQDSKVGKGLPLLTEKGALIRRLLIRYIEDKEVEAGYLHTATPVLGSSDFFSISGHWQLYRDSMFVIPIAANDVYALRPMTCPYHFQLYNRKVHSYRELPIRYAETSLLFRNEASGAIHGLNRIRQFTLSDGHIICRQDQIEGEFIAALELVQIVMEKLGITDYWYRFSTHDPDSIDKYIDDDDAWSQSEKLLEDMLGKLDIDYKDGSGEAAFYGPKLDIQLRDVYGREETLFTLQLDFALPRRFGMYYTDENDEKKVPYVIHRSSIGCYERTLAHLLELYQGRLPFWLAPVQIILIPVHFKNRMSARLLLEDLVRKGFRCRLDDSDESVGKRIRNVYVEKIPLMCIIGDKEEAAHRFTVSHFSGKEKLFLSFDELVHFCESL